LNWYIRNLRSRAVVVARSDARGVRVLPGAAGSGLRAIRTCGGKVWRPWASSMVRVTIEEVEDASLEQEHVFRYGAPGDELGVGRGDAVRSVRRCSEPVDLLLVVGGAGGEVPGRALASRGWCGAFAAV